MNDNENSSYQVLFEITNQKYTCLNQNIRNYLKGVVKNDMQGFILNCHYKLPLEEISTQNGPFNFNSNSISSCVSK